MTSPIIIQNAQLQSFNRREWTPTDLFVGGEQGMWYDPSDLTVEKVAWRRNLLTYSENFENAAWSKGNSSILSNLALYSQDFNLTTWFKIGVTINANVTTAPDSTTTADKLVEDSSTGTHVILPTPFFAINVGATYTGTVYAKSAERTSIQLLDNSQPSCGATFDLSTGTVVQTEVGVTSAGIESVGNGWYRCRITYVASVVTANLQIRLVSSGTTTSYTGDGTSGAFIWGAQLVPGSTAQTYTRSLVTAAPILFTDAFGGVTAQKLVENTASGQHYISNAGPTLTAGIPYTYTLYEKAEERSRFQIYGYLSPGTFSYSVDVNLTTKTLSAVNNCTASLLELPNGWFRTNVTFTPTITGQAYSQLYLFSGSTSTNTFYTGSGTAGLYVYGAQVEQGTTASAYQKITDFNTEFLSTFPTHTLYQESTGVTPVTTLGQSVGLVLDKRLGALTNLGPELVTNGTFTTGSGWSTGGGTWVIADGLATLTTSPPGVLSQPSTAAVVGRTYLVTFTVTNHLSGSVRVEFGGVNGVVRTTNGTYTQFITATTTNILVMQPTTTTTLLALDNISIREVPGNHIVQSTIGSRPTLQARKNLLKSTEQFDTGDWVKGTGVTASANLDTAPDGTLTADYVAWSAVGPGSFLRGYPVITSGSTYTYSVYARMISGSATFTMDFGNTGYSPTFTPTSTWQRFAYTRTYEGTNQWVDIEVSAPCTMSLWGAQVELSSTTSSYQRVVTDTNYADVGISRALQFDGIDDSLVTTQNVDFSRTDKVTLFTGVTKLVDSASNTFVEFGPNSATTNGTFGMFTNPNGYRWRTRGTINVEPNVSSGYVVPITNVLTGISNIAGDIATLRINGTNISTLTDDQGTGNFNNQILYIGRRGGTTLPFNGRIHQLLINGRQFSGDEITRTEQWIASRTGVTL